MHNFAHILGEGKILCGRQDGTCTLYNTRSSHQIVLSGKVKYYWFRNKRPLVLFKTVPFLDFILINLRNDVCISSFGFPKYIIWIDLVDGSY